MRFRPLVVFPLAKLALHLATLPGYGWFRDEFYYLACSERLDFGYVDQPPLSIVLLWMARALLGDSIWAVRLLPALAGAATVLVVGLIARELGGSRFAQSVAMISVGFAPVHLALDHFFSTNAFDLLFWALAALLVVRADEYGPRKFWLLLGLILGLGLQNKISVLWLGAGLAVGLLATARRRDFRTPWPWAGAGVTLLLFLPHVLWQVAHDWPTLEFIRNATQEKMIAVSAIDFARSQVEMMNPFAAPLWLLGLGWLLVSPRARPHRSLGWAYVAVFFLLALSGSSRAGYLAPAYGWLLPAGGVALEGWTERPGRRWLRVAALAVLVVTGILLMPFGLPVLRVDKYIAYARALGQEPSTEERKELGELPQHYADMHGWEGIASTVAEVYRSLPAEEQAKAAVYTMNYGVAGAIEWLAKLPRVTSGHNNYWLWGPRGAAGEVVIIVGGRVEDHRQRFASVERAATIDCGYCMPYENHAGVYVGRGLKQPLEELWPRLKHFD